jgi:hypothetical protein
MIFLPFLPRNFLYELVVKMVLYPKKIFGNNEIIDHENKDMEIERTRFQGFDYRVDQLIAKRKQYFAYYKNKYQIEIRIYDKN